MTAKTVTATGLSVVEYIGELVATHDNGAVTLKHKKPRSSKMLERDVSPQNLLGVYEDGEGGVTVYVQEQTELLSAHGEVSHDGATIVVTSSEGETTRFFPQPGVTIDIVSDSLDD